MADLQNTLNDFIAAYQRDGSADPRDYLSRVEGIERRELRALIEAYLERAPRRDWDREEFSGSIAERAVDAAMATDEGAEGWSELLPTLRHEAELKRVTVVERLAAAIGFSGEEDRVAAYYHGMERGQLPSPGVSSKVLEALASILGTSAAALRRAGEAGEAGQPAGGEVFARGGTPEGMQSPAGAAVADADAADRAEPDELDRLFTGGG